MKSRSSFSAALLAACLFASIAHAAPPAITGRAIQAQIPQFGEGGAAPVLINLRQLGVISGSGPLRVALGQSRVFVNGKTDERLPATAFRGVCVRIDNLGFSPSDDVGLTYQLQLTVGNGGRITAGPQLVNITNTPGPTINPENPADLRACDDPNSRPTANAGADRAIADSDGSPGETVALDGGQSSDADPGTVLSYVWRNAQGVEIATGPSPQAVRLPDGANVITLTVTDDSFDPQTNSSTDTVTVTVGAAAQPPRANAGPDQTVPDTDSAAGENVTLSGAESSDPDGSIVAYVWRNAAGATIATTANAQVRLPDGVNNLTLTVTDNAQLSASDSVVVTVNPPENRPPVANAGPDQTVPDTDHAAGENVTLNGAASSDADGTIVSYVWRNAAGAQIATGATPQVRLPDGDSTITLTVTDNSERSASDSVLITVNSPTNRPPVANAGPDQTVADTDQQAGENVTLDGRQSSDADGAIVSYVWRNAAGAQIATGANPQVRLPDGTNTITLTVSDNGELSANDTIVITVNRAANRPPVANAGPDRTVADTDQQAGENVTLDGRQSSDADGAIASYVWRNAAGAQVATGANPQVRLPDGANTITLTVTDNGELSASDSVVITVRSPENRPPVANAGPNQTVADTDQQTGEAVTLDGRQSSDADGAIASYVWSNEAGAQIATGANPQVRAPDGANTFTLTVTDSGGLTATDTVLITVGAANQAPAANAGADQNVADSDRQPGENVRLDAAQSSDPDGTIASYVWRNSAGAQLATGANPQVRLPDGSTTIVLTVTDNRGATGADSLVITVAAPPGRPQAHAGPDQTVQDTDQSPGETVTLDGSSSVDPAGAITSFIWRNASGAQIASGATAQVRAPDGVNSITLTITGPNNVTASDTVVITVVAPVGPAPSANAGPDQNVPDTDQRPGENVTLDASGSSDAGGEIESYVWRNAAGAQIATGVNPRVRLPDGANVITLTTTDDDGLTASDSVAVTVAAPVGPRPSANAGADQTVQDTDRQPGENVTLDASGSSDAGGEIASYAWRNAAGAQIATGVNPQVRLPDGANVITLTVTDNDGLTATDSVRITVAAPPANQPPVANAGSDRNVADTDRQPGENVTLDASGSSDAGGEIASYAWRNAAGAQIATGANPQVRLPDGANVITLTVTDDDGLTATDSVRITVAAPTNQPPVTNAGSDQNVADTDRLPGENVTLDASGSSDAGGEIASYEWRNAAGTQIATGPNPQVRLPDGENVITLTATDDGGVSATDSVVITVAAPINQAPVANAGVDLNVADTDQRPGERVALDGSQSSDTDGTIVSYVWSNGSGAQIGTGANLQVRLPDGASTIVLTVTDDDGVSATDTVAVAVAESPRPTTLADLPNLTRNQRAIAGALDRICARLESQDEDASLSEDQENLRARCEGLRYRNTQANQVEALTELNGEDFALARTQTLLFANTQYASVMDRLIALRGGARGLSLAGLSISVNGELVPLQELYAMAKDMLGGGASADGASAADLFGDKWGMWARGNYSFGEKDANAASPRFEASQWALVGGLDYRFSDKAVGGVALAYGGSQVEFDPLDEGALDTRSWALSAYGSLYAAKNFYFDAIVNFADAQYDAERNISYVDGVGLVTAGAAGATTGLTLSGGLSAGYDFLIGGLTVSPNLGFFYIDATIDGFTESGAGGLNLIYDEQKFQSLTGNLGLRLTYAWNLPWGVLLPHLRIDYVREFEDDVDVFGVRFASDPNASSSPPILVETENPDTSYWRLATGFSTQFRYGVSAYIEYQRLESFEFISFQDISVGLRMQKRF